MRRHAHEGDMRTKETYTRKDIGCNIHRVECTVHKVKCTKGGVTQSGVYSKWSVHKVECTQGGVYTGWSIHSVECTYTR